MTALSSALERIYAILPPELIPQAVLVVRYPGSTPGTEGGTMRLEESGKVLEIHVWERRMLEMEVADLNRSDREPIVWYTEPNTPDEVYEAVKAKIESFFSIRMS